MMHQVRHKEGKITRKVIRLWRTKNLFLYFSTLDSYTESETAEIPFTQTIVKKTLIANKFILGFINYILQKMF